FEEMSFKEKRALLRSLIERVEVYPDKLVVRVFVVGGLDSNGHPCDINLPTIKLVQTFKQSLPEGDWPGAALARARVKAGLTIKELSKRAGVSELTISAWERNVNKPQAMLFAKVASCLGVPLNALGPTSFLKAARARLGLTQKELGCLLGVSRFRIQEWEAGRRGIPAGIAARISSLPAKADGGPGERAQASF
ncbi:MAG: helix-turn-helix transcriptional regulator, partial [Bacillota bacterium]